MDLAIDNNIIKIEDLSFSYKEKIIFSNFSNEFKEGYLNLILGPNGVGKSTLLKIMLSILKPESGKIYYKENVKISYIPQWIDFDSSIMMEVKDIVLMGLIKKAWFFPSKKDKEKVKNALKKVGLDKKFLNMSFKNLSGGERQRVLIARAIVSDDFNLLIADEPFSNVDYETKMFLKEFLEDFCNFNDSSKSAILITHESFEFDCKVNKVDFRKSSTIWK